MMPKIALISILIVTHNSFGQLAENTIEIGQNNLYALKKNNGELITPPIFISLTRINQNCYLFEADSKYSGRLQHCIDSLIVPNSDNSELDDDQYFFFQGFIDSSGRIIGNEDFRMVESIIGKENPTFFMAQSINKINKNENWHYALVNENGVILSPFHYEYLWFKNGDLFGTIVTDESFTTVKLNAEGHVKEVINEQLR